MAGIDLPVSEKSRVPPSADKAGTKMLMYDKGDK